MSSVSDMWGAPTVWTCHHNSSDSSDSTGLQLEIETPWVSVSSLDRVTGID